MLFSATYGCIRSISFEAHLSNSKHVRMCIGLRLYTCVRHTTAHPAMGCAVRLLRDLQRLGARLETIKARAIGSRLSAFVSSRRPQRLARSCVTSKACAVDSRLSPFGSSMRPQWFARMVETREAGLHRHDFGDFRNSGDHQGACVL